ncbi:hypothetical protein C0J52_09047 [Blattella germanica]|nr:hypothetical protein C0J52_09047 [Blattella germanica]
MVVPTVKLNNNYDFPVLGFGTYKAGNPGEVVQVVKDAIDVGFRHIDGAMFYENENEVGAAIKDKIAEGVVKREDLFVTSKEGDVLNPFDEEGMLIPSDVDYVDTWKQMEECAKQGLAKSIGLSNFNSQQITRILEVATIKPVVNQVECHPYLNQSKLIAFCKERDIVVTAYSPLGSPGVIAKPDTPAPLKDPIITKIAEKHGKSVAQTILRYLIQHDVVPIPKSSNRKRMEENFNVFDFQLTAEEVSEIDGVDRNCRIVPFPQYQNQGEAEQLVKDAIDIGYRHIDTAMIYGNEKEVGAGIRAKIAEGVVKREDIFITTKATKEGEAEQLVKDAIDIGYRHIDTAMIYGNEKEVGAGIRAKIAEGVVKREDIFITTKLWCSFHKRESVVEACKKSLANLGLDYLDLYIIHSPNSLQEGDDLLPKDKDGNFLVTDVDYVDTWKGMEECAKLGLAKSIGLSNFNSQQINRLLEAATIKPAVNQIQHGTVPIPKSSSKNRLKENFEIFDFEISKEDKAAIDALNKNIRICQWEITRVFKINTAGQNRNAQRLSTLWQVQFSGIIMFSVKLNNGRNFPVIGVGTLFARNEEAEQLVKNAIDIGYRHIDTAKLYENEKEIGSAIRAKIAEGVVKREDIFLTTKARNEEAEQLVKNAIDIGYRHIDTAKLYENEKEIGSAIRAKIAEGVVKREDIFLTTKLWSTCHRRELVVESCKQQLTDLGLDYIDLYLIHTSNSFKEGDDLWPRDADGKLQITDVDYLDTWKGMEECVKLGLVKSIGISNFNSQQINRILEAATIKPVVNQVIKELQTDTAGANLIFSSRCVFEMSLALLHKKRKWRNGDAVVEK